MNIVVTNHAKKRMIQRYKLFMRQIEIDNVSMFIKKQFETAHKYYRTHRVPFRESVLKSRHGKDAEVWVNKNFKFFVNVINYEKFIIKSVVKIGN